MIVDQVDRDRRDKSAQTALGLEGGAEGIAVESGPHVPDNAAADVDTALGADRQRQITRHGAENAGKHAGGLDAGVVFGGGRLGGDVLGRQALDLATIEGTQCFIEVDQARAGDSALGRSVAMAPTDPGGHTRLPLGALRHGHMAAFAMQRHPFLAAENDSGYP